MQIHALLHRFSHNFPPTETKIMNHSKQEIFSVSHEVKDVKSISRALERSLVLVVKQKLGTSEEWVFPHTPWQPGETLRQVNYCFLVYLLIEINNDF